MTTHKVLETNNIPHPKEKLLIGNLLELQSGRRVQDMMKLAREYGPIYQLNMPGRSLIVVSGYELVKELSDETRFDKKVWTPLQNVRSFSGDGLFTSWTNEPNWHKAHNILLPNFSMRAMQGYLPMMVDIAEQLVGKWDRLNSDDEVDVPGDMTRLTLDTIGLCGFDYRFNSFYREDMHPFVNSMIRALQEAMERGSRLPLEDKILIHKNRQFHADIEFLNGVVDRIIQERREGGEDVSQKKDLLSYMLSGVDKQSGEKLDDLNIRYQIITFLIAGHETTSGLLSFAMYELLHHPEVLARAYEEVDRVLGNDLSARPTFNQVNQLRYVSQILQETLRLWPTAPAFAMYPLNDNEIIGGKYKLTKDEDIAVLIPMLHRDPTIWGANADEFDPEHFTLEAEQSRPADAYKPFGNGQRACIGRQFAMQEATLVLGMLLQRYKFIDHTNYQFKIKETLTIKPDNFKIKIRKRSDADRTIIVQPQQENTQVRKEAPKATPRPEVPKHDTPLLILFGSNMGTAEDIANRMVEDGNAYGFKTTIADLDEYTNALPTEGAVVVVSASYNGTPPDNAEKFCNWLRSGDLTADRLKGVKYMVFGCGNRDWAATFQAIPRLIDTNLEKFGAERIYARGEGDAREDFDGQFEAWYQPLWKSLFEEFGIEAKLPEPNAVGSAYEVEVIPGMHSHPLIETFGARPARVLLNKELYSPTAERSARHIEFELPEGVNYRTGFHLGIIPHNSEAMVERVARRFNFASDTYILLRKSDNRKTNLPVEMPVSVYSLLRDYVELQDVATRKQIKAMADFTQCPPDKKKLLALSGDDEASIALYKTEVLAKRKSIIDLLEDFPACELPFNAYLELLSMMRPRYYSISSSPLQDEKRCSVTVAVVDAPARSGHGQYQGVCSNYLRQQQQGDQINAFIQDTRSTFMLPEDASVPLIMVGPGTGVAPFRGFLQERDALKASGKTVGDSLLFFGCRHPEQDFLYAEEFKALESRGITEVITAFSRWEGHDKMYVQDQLLNHKDRVWELIQAGAMIYVCGDASNMAPDVRQAFVTLYQEKAGVSAEAAEQWLNEQTSNGRYLVDVWPS
ncbi:bifunctional cytochrome P450/NADPH--P450 reductase [Dictyobacter kobayashii]|uniref:Bifunctional cytochrome P450/NADPH--P450 reductase n=1 Tax=Dictyobacter kobayashii TaxID=2014872 RepID=A0A402ALY8_9CHLR|nr:cytochrome P450 [Dictyobacter kobayashii]GCE20055.1 NADPH--cytochrome P450 reductase [Dictyobacter kobayashii]